MVAEESTNTEGADRKKKTVGTKKPQKPSPEGKLSKTTICIKQIGSPIRRDPRQALYLNSLGLGKLNRVRHIVDSPSTRGLLDKLRHMVVVVDQ